MDKNQSCSNISRSKIQCELVNDKDLGRVFQFMDGATKILIPAETQEEAIRIYRGLTSSVFRSNGEKMESEWKRVSSCLPPNGRVVETKIDDKDGVRNVQRMHRQGNLWFVGGIYVYFTPTHWREINDDLHHWN